MFLSKLEKPEFWDKHNLTVTCDGYFENGVRIHLVKEDVEPQFLSNAFVMCDRDWLNGKPNHWLNRQAHFALEKLMKADTEDKKEVYRVWWDEMSDFKNTIWEED